MKRFELFILSLGLVSATGCCAVDRLKKCGKLDHSPCLASSCTDLGGCADASCFQTETPVQARPMPLEPRTSEPLDLQETPPAPVPTPRPGVAPPPPGQGSGPVDYSPGPNEQGASSPVVRLMRPVPFTAESQAAYVQDQMDLMPARRPVLIPIGHRIKQTGEKLSAKLN